jgi:diguanylate cyclase (GGDEF)-like protein
MIATVKRIMERELITIDVLHSVLKAKDIMLKNRIGCLPVMDDGLLVGIVTTWDILFAHSNRIVADAMTSPVIGVNPNASLWEAKEKMELNSIERLVVVEDGELLGLVTKTKLYSEIAKHYDSLTELYRRDYIVYQGAKLLEKGVEISVIFFDLDGFGLIDKEHGHIQGDIILKELGALLLRKVPKDCFLCRFGGDEFVVLTPYKKEGCMALAQELLETIAQHNYGIKVDITASAGIAGGRRENGRTSANCYDDVENLLNLASLASTRAKKDKVPLIMASGFSFIHI